MKIGIFGGSFNPPHNMHKNIALKLINNGYLDKVIFVPTGDKYNKDGLLNQKDRYNMVKLMIEGCDNLEVSDYEFNKLTYTYETLDYFKNIYKDDDIYFICGSDNLKQITLWRKYDYILRNYKIIVIRRNNDDIDKMINNLLIYYKNIICITDIQNSVSSTLIRENLNKNNDVYLLQNMDTNVLKYIKNNSIIY